MQKGFLGFMLVAALLFVSSCNTAEGVGKDLESAGRTIQDTVN